MTAPYMTTAQVAGETYIYLSGVGCFSYNFGWNALDEVTLVGVDTSEILGIFAAQGYLCVYTADSVAWCSTLDTLDFTPSLATGAGGGVIEQVRGHIITVEPNVTGFIIYSTANAVIGVFSGNDRYPFNFRELASSAGIAKPGDVSTGSNGGVHFVYGTSGLQQVKPTGAEQIFPEVSDFLSSKYMDDINAETLEITRTILTNTALRKAVTFVADRYLVISYGPSYFTHALVFDAALERFGKLKVDHTQCFQYTHTAAVDVDNVRASIGFLTPVGQILTVNSSQNVGTWSQQPAASKATAIFGKFQLVRSRMTTLYEVEIETVRQADDFTCHSLYTLDGKNWTDAAGVRNVSADYVRNYFFRHTGLNHSICLRGKFNLNTLILHLAPHGRM